MATRNLQTAQSPHQVQARLPELESKPRLPLSAAVGADIHHSNTNTTTNTKNDIDIIAIRKDNDGQGRNAPVFISVTDPMHTKTGHLRKLIRSHAARISHGKTSSSGGGSVAKRRHQRKTVTLELASGQASPSSTSSAQSSTWLMPPQSSSASDRLTVSTSGELLQLLRLPLERRMGGGRVDPFKSYPVPWEPFIPKIVDYYLMNMAVDCEELDQNRKGLLRISWFPLAMTNPATFQVILLIAASHFISLCGKNSLIPDLVALKGKTITYINSGLKDKDDCISDGMIGAVAKMASFEAMFGEVEIYKIHMTGLMRMVQMRGGLDNLGLNGLLARIILWIDLNSSFLLNGKRFFDAEGRLRMLPNPGQFLGAS